MASSSRRAMRVPLSVPPASTAAIWYRSSEADSIPGSRSTNSRTLTR